MKTYLKENKPKIALILVLILFLSNILTLLIPGATELIILYPTNISEPWNWYRLLTYSLYVGGLWTWLHNSLVIVLTGYVVESKLSKGEILILVLLSSIIGGLMFMIFNQNQSLNLPVANPNHDFMRILECSDHNRN